MLLEGHNAHSRSDESTAIASSNLTGSVVSSHRGGPGAASKVLWNPAISQLLRSFVSTIEKQAL
jgi:hypothetical protein